NVCTFIRPTHCIQDYENIKMKAVSGILNLRLGSGHFQIDFAVLALFVVFAVAFAAEPAKDLKGSEQFYFGYGAPYAGYAAYSAYPYAGLGYYYR
ncbi:hypothetical protein L9F63_011626, partial [Diploptera punctata]